MKISQIPAALDTALSAELSVLLKSGPGTAKTASVRQFAAKKKMKLIHIHAPLVDLLDLKGVISTQGDEAKFLPFNTWPKASDDPVVILIDELPQCVPAIQNAFSQLLIDKKMGDITLPKGSLVVATGNRREDKAATHNIPSHVISRVMHIEVDRSNDDFFEWGMKNGVSAEVIAFGHWKPDAIYNFDPKNSQEPYGCYRTWEYVSNILKSKPPTELLGEMIAGVVGKGISAEFMAYRRLFSQLPDPQQILTNPHATTIPTDPGTLYAISTSIAHYVTKDNADNFFSFISRLPTEYAVMCVKMTKAVLPTLPKTKAFSIWANANSHIIL